MENSLIQPSEAKEFSPITPRPLGPIMIPDKINPMIPGILNFLNKIGESKMMKSIRENTKTGFVNGNLNSLIRCSRKTFIEAKIEDKFVIQSNVQNS